MTTEQKVLELVVAECCMPCEVDSAFDDLNMDSLDFVDLILQIDNEFGVKIPEPELTKMETVSDLISVVERLLPVA